MDSRKAEGKEFTINLSTPDNGEKFVVELSNATLTNIAGHQAEDAVLSVTNLELVMRGEKTLAAQIDDGTAKTEGDRGVLDQLRSMLVTFELGFEVLPGTASPQPKEDLNLFEQGPVELRGE
jgi:alkyl sulfatase BDS1-like metallo-beta-lactamase superfamily hydrolase